MIAIGLIGLGEVGQHHQAAITQASGVRYAWACDLDPSLLAASGAERTTAQVEEVLADPAVDAVSICLPHHLHLTIGLAALNAGKHVLVEKPMAVTVADADALIEAASETGRSLGVSHNQLFYAPHVRAKQLIENGELGRVRQLRSRLAIGGKYGAWRSDPTLSGGGLLFDAGVHRVYLLRSFGGEVRAVTAVMDAPGAEDSFVVTLEFASGAFGVIDGTYHCAEGAFDDRVEIAGTNGMVELAGLEAYFEGYADLSAPSLRVYTGGAWREEPVRDSWDATVHRSVQGFCSAIAAGDPPPVTAHDGRAVAAIIEAAYASARSGRRVELAV